MTAAQLLLYLLIGTPQERAALKQKAKTFCEQHLIADDPYQFRELTTEQLVNAWFALKENGKMPYAPLVAEIRLRLSDPRVPEEQKEILTRLTGITLREKDDATK